jgi:hypothetical protein
VEFKVHFIFKNFKNPKGICNLTTGHQLTVTKNDTSVYLPQGIEDRPVPIHCDSCECEDTHIHTQHLDKRAEGAHKVRQVPALQQRRLELK